MRLNTKPKKDHRRETNPHYLTKDWKNKKDKVWERDDYMCQICLDKGIEHHLVRNTKDVNFQGTVDHIKPLRLGGSDELHNLRLVGTRCHAVKSNQDKKLYKK